MPHTPKAISAHVNETITIRKILKYSANLLTYLIIDLFWNSLQFSIKPWPIGLECTRKLITLVCLWLRLASPCVQIWSWPIERESSQANARACIQYTRPGQANKPASIYNSVWRRINCFIIPSLNFFCLLLLFSFTAMSFIHGCDWCKFCSERQRSQWCWKIFKSHFRAERGETKLGKYKTAA